MAAIDPKKRVFVYVPFSAKEADTGKKDDWENPIYSGKAWVAGKNLLPGTNKEYSFLNPESFVGTEFRRGDRIYVHGHGSPKNPNLWATPSGDAHRKPADLWHDMTANPSFKALVGTDALDLRIAACHSFESSKSLAPALRKLAGKPGRIKGKEGELGGFAPTIFRNGKSAKPGGHKGLTDV